MTQLTFLYTQSELNAIAAEIVAQALEQGASAAQVELSESISTDVEVLNQNIDNFETSHENQLLLTVYQGHKKGNVGISSIRPSNLAAIITQALDIAKYTQEDPHNGLLEPEFLLTGMHADLGLYNEYQIDNQFIIATTKELEQLAQSQNPRIRTSDGASTSLTKYNFVTANSNGFNFGYQTSRYSKYVSLIGQNQHGMQTDYWYSGTRAFEDLLSNQYIAQTAVQRVLRRLDSDTLSAGKPKIIFESGIAKSIIASLIGALNGSSLYRRLSFLNDSLGNQILPEWLNISEDPFVYRGISSCYFDNEGSRVWQRNIIENGCVKGYLLSSYSARKMNLAPTGNAGGSHNLAVNHNFAGGLNELAAEAQDGLLIIETIGHGLNMVTGDYSVGASGLVIRGGEICGYVDNLTIAGNLRDILANICLIANDSEPCSVVCGSMLINSGIIQVST